jgi:hypothetical protein
MLLRSTFFPELAWEERFHGFFRRLAGVSEKNAHWILKKLLKSSERDKFSYFNLFHGASSVVHPPLIKNGYQTIH